jgi:hypothetical protein
MFATIEEAEKAQTMLRRFAGQDSWMIHPHSLAVALGIGHGQTICDWEELADFLLLERQGAGPREAHLARVRSCVAAVRRQLGWGRDALDREMIDGLTAAFEALLEALA